MQILLFDMDGVLLEPNGYHQALKETVRLTSLSLGFNELNLAQEDIAQFESLGISNEWHSSALCMALMVIEGQKRNLELNLSPQLRLSNSKFETFELNLPDLYKVISAQPVELPSLSRAQSAIELTAEKAGVDSTIPSSIMQECEQINQSLTLNIFQELVLGSQTFAKTYGVQSQLGVNSYLNEYDKPLLSPNIRTRLTAWLDESSHYAAIMTNRPSDTLLGLPGTPEAELGAALVGLDFLPIIGSGEMIWLAKRIDQDVGALVKPSAHHALSGIFAALGQAAPKALSNSHQIISGKHDSNPIPLNGCTVSVFEDTPAGILAVERVKEVLSARKSNIQVHKAGIATDTAKRTTLEALGATVFDTVNSALENFL